MLISQGKELPDLERLKNALKEIIDSYRLVAKIKETDKVNT
jgi:hypothetical protein